MGNIDRAPDRMSSDAEGFFAIPLSTLCVETMTKFDLYLNPPGCLNPLLYRRANLTFTEKHRLTLVESGVHELHVRSVDRHEYLDYLARTIHECLF